jgi:iron complex transport system ATP-binding protein
VNHPSAQATQADPPLLAEDLCVRYRRGAEPVLDGQSIALPAGKIMALVGPNGSGKSTLLKSLARQLKPDRGQVLLDGRDVHTMPLRQLARRLGILFQEHPTPGGLSVEHLAEHGRYPHRGMFEPLSQRDRAAIDHAFELSGIEHLRHRRLDQLSGGQKQLAWITMILAQEPAVLLLDEPTTFLDMRHQLEVMRIVERLRDEKGLTIALVLHDLNQAARHCDRLVAMRNGAVVAAGPPWEVLSKPLLRDVFGVEAEILRDGSGLPVCVPTSIPAPTGQDGS